MPAFTLSTGITLLSEQIEQADYYPRGSLRNDVALSGRTAQFERDFLFIRTVEGPLLVRGDSAARDANALEDCGVRVYRRPMATASHTS